MLTREDLTAKDWRDIARTADELKKQLRENPNLSEKDLELVSAAHRVGAR